MAFSSSIIGAVFVRWASVLVANYPLMLYILLLNAFTLIPCVILIIFKFEPVSFFSCDSLTGFFGMFQKE
jgi:hypothetical protein